MNAHLINFAILAAPADPAWSFGLHSAISKWILFPTLIASALAIYYLYKAQKRIASRRIVGALTVIRMLLVLLVFVLLVGPALVRTKSETTAGTLWLVLDQSQSMALTDPQATPAERLRWADTLGYLPDEVHFPSLDRPVAELISLNAELPQLRLQRVSPGASRDDSADPIQTFLTSIRDWRKRLVVLNKTLAKDEALKLQTPDLTKTIDLACSLLEAGATQAENRKSLNDAIEDIPWDILKTNLDGAIAKLDPLAEKLDLAFLSAHGNDAAVKAALAKVEKLSRADLAVLALTEKLKHGEKNLADLLPNYHIKIAAISDVAQAIQEVNTADAKSTIKSILTPSTAGQATNLAAGLQLINEQIGPEEPASVIVISDGRQNTGGDFLEAARALASRGVRVNTLAIGSRQVAPDVAVEQTDAPDWIYKDDTLKIAALIRLDGVKDKKLNVEFLRGSTVIDTKPVTATSNQTTQTLSFQDKPAEAGVIEYQVRVAEAPGEVNKENNRQSFHISVKKDKLAVLMIDEQPRWEFRYLSSYLTKDQRIKLQTMLLQPAKIDQVTPPEPAKASPKNARTEAEILPQTKEEWAAFDMIILGDVPPDALPAAAQQMIASVVRDKGTTLLVLAGQHYMPSRFADTPPGPIADLLPVQLAPARGDPPDPPYWPSDTLAEHMRGGFKPAMAPEGMTSILSQFGLDADANSKLWSAVPVWYWHSEQTQTKPSASVIWTITETPEHKLLEDADAGTLASARRRALLSTMSVGLGRVLYLASDQTWRMRQVNGENLQDRFWGQVIRWAVASDLPAGGRFVRFGANKPRYVGGEPIIITARVLKEDLTPMVGETFQVIARSVPAKSPATAPAAGGDGAATAKIVAQASMVESPEAPGYYRGTLNSLPQGGAGTIEISLQGANVEKLLDEDQTAVQKNLTVQVQSQMNLEQRNLNTDRETLQQIARAGNGLALDGPSADVLAEHIPALSHESKSLQQIGFFTDPRDPTSRKSHMFFLLTFVTLITAEWIIRKLAGLV